MKRNVGTLDRVIRLLLAVAVAALYFTGQISGALAIVLGVAAAILLLTSFAASCPLYSLLGMSTCPAQRSSG